MTAIYESFTNQKQWEVYLKDLVKTNDTALLRAIVRIYDKQTLDEKSIGETIDKNRVGFSKVDAYEMGKIARKVKKGENLTKGELAKSRNKMQKYWKQLMTISKQRLDERKQERQEEFCCKVSREDALYKCSEEGIPCEYGICDECPLTVKLLS